MTNTKKRRKKTDANKKINNIFRIVDKVEHEEHGGITVGGVKYEANNNKID